MTLQGALRYDRAWSWSPADEQGIDHADRFHPGAASRSRAPRA